MIEWRQHAPRSRSPAGALSEWSEQLGAERVSDPADAQARYGACTTGVSRQIAGALRPRQAEDLPAIVRTACAHRIPLYPISTGRNWGYGTALPAVDGCVIVDLSGLRGIACIDGDAGVFRLEPGVTQADLHAYLAAQELPFMVPTTGAGPRASLVGNALERGYGITPIADHFAAVMRIEAILPDGSMYRSALSELGAPAADQLFKWGLGPYLDGLFSQGNFGIVTAMSFALARRPERVEAFYFRVDQEKDLPRVVDAVRTVLQRLPGVAGGINLMNRRRVLAMIATAPRDDAGRTRTLSEDEVERLARRHAIGAWMGMGALYGTVPVVAAARRAVRAALQGRVSRLSFLSTRRAALLGRLQSVLPVTAGNGLSALLARIQASLQILEGVPNAVALPLAYWKAPRAPANMEGGHLDPARDGCGLVWYAPLVPMRPAVVERYVQQTEAVCRAHGVEPLITLSSLSERCFDSSVPLLFDPGEPGVSERVHRCYDALMQAGLALGVAPYRAQIGAMQSLIRPESAYWRTVRAIKHALDPMGIVAPGRYAPVERR